MQKTIAVTDLDALLWHHNSEQTWEEFATRLMRRAPRNIYTAIGSDLHSAVQQAAHAKIVDGEVGDTIENIDGLIVDKFDMPKHPQLDLLPIANGALEVPVQYTVKYGEMDSVQLVGYIDVIDTRGELWEIKSTTKSSGWAERYFNSYQWRAYALASRTTTPVHYAVFFLKYDRDTVETTRRVTVTDVTELSVLPYERMAQDVEQLALQFAQMMDNHLPAYWMRSDPAVKATPLKDILRDPRQFLDADHMSGPGL